MSEVSEASIKLSFSSLTLTVKSVRGGDFFLLEEIGFYKYTSGICMCVNRLCFGSRQFHTHLRKNFTMEPGCFP